MSVLICTRFLFSFIIYFPLIRLPLDKQISLLVLILPPRHFNGMDDDNVLKKKIIKNALIFFSVLVKLVAEHKLKPNPRCDSGHGCVLSYEPYSLLLVIMRRLAKH